LFSNLNWYNIVVLLLIALFIFGDKLPQVIADGMRMLRNLRRMAQDATSDLSREFGTEVRLEDLNPKTFLRRHLLSEEDQQTLARPFRSVSDDLKRHTSDLREEARRTGDAMGPLPSRSTSAPQPQRPAAGSAAGSAAADGSQPVAPEYAPPRQSYDDIT
jgi:sec-independent protein translocase protein TatB